MAGIVAAGGYVPRYRLDRKLIYQAMSWFNPGTAGVARGEKAVASHDEDSVTMAVAAARDALGAGPAAGVDALYLASTTLPYAERQNAAIVAGALGLPAQARSLDLGGSTRAGTSALLAALDAVEAKSANLALVAAADCRLGRMGGRSEHLQGDAAAAFLVGREDVAAELISSASVTADFVDVRRAAGDRFGRGWEERWIRDLGHGRLLAQAAQACLARCGAAPTSLKRVVVAGPDAKAAAGLLKGWGLPPEALQDNFAATVGETGAAHAPLMLAAALEQAGPGERILVLGWGSGADALLFETTARIGQLRRGLCVAGHIGRRAVLDSYEKYCVFRRLLPLDAGIRGESMATTAFSALWRDRGAALALQGNRCKRCSTPHFPPGRVCIHPECGAVDELEPYPFAQRLGKVFTYTADSLAFSVDPPAIYGLVDMEGGGRLFLDFTDCRQDEVKVGMTVGMTFRRKYLDEAGGVHGYFWKARPA